MYADELEMLAGDGDLAIGAANLAIGAGDLVDIVGAEATKKIFAELRAAGGKPNVAAVVPRQPNRFRQLLLGVPVTALAAAIGAVGTATIETSDPFRPSRLFLDDNVADDVLVESIKIGSREQILNANPLPGSMFKSTAVGGTFEFDTINSSTKMVIRFSNLIATAQTVRGGVKGAAVY